MFRQTGGPPRVHDPVIARENGVYYLYSTGRNVALHVSKDREHWQLLGPTFTEPIPWTEATIPGSREIYWAPDISFFEKKWHLYYSVSTFGKNRSAIGHATNVTLDPKRPDYRWKDEGIVIETKPGVDNWNAIDPNIAFDDKKRLWLSAGSFWSGIQLVELDPKTGKRLHPDAPLVSIASRPNTREIQGSVEAPFIVRHDRYFYLFVSFDFCCRGINSTYNVRVGRAKAITGPYVDRDGKPMTEGGGTLVRSGTTGRWRGTGHCSVFVDDKKDWLVYHAYDADDNGASKLGIDRLTWDRDGWPVASGQAAQP